MIVPSIQKSKQGTHVVQQMEAFSYICQHIEDHNKLPVQLFNQEIAYDPNALGHSDKILFYKKYFGHEVITYGNGRIVLSNSKGEIIREGDVFVNDNEIIFQKYTDTEPYIHR